MSELFSAYPGQDGKRRFSPLMLVMSRGSIYKAWVMFIFSTVPSGLAEVCLFHINYSLHPTFLLAESQFPSCWSDCTKGDAGSAC